MTSFPIFKSLRTSGYGLYPGTKQKPDIDIEFQAGLTLVLGANGLGKTTLVTLLYRMCTGGYEISSLAAAGELGGKKLQARRLSSPRRRLFADRVNDGAVHSSATLEFNLAETTFSLTRSLATLDLLKLTVDGDEVEATDAAYQQLVEKHARVNKFGDWILLLRHLTFYFEDRRALVWDPSAQRQLLRLLFLSPNTSAEWEDSERDVLQRDSAARNLQAVLSSQEQSLTNSEEAATSDGDLREELATLEELQKVDRPNLEQLNDSVTELASVRQSARLAALKAENENESAFRDLERRQLTAISAAFPSSGDTARYLITQLVSDEECLACGSQSPKAAGELADRIARHRCVVCNSLVEKGHSKSPSARTIAKASKALEKTSVYLEATKERQKQVDLEFEQLVSEIQELNARVAERSARIDSLARRLPPGEAELHEQRGEVTSMRGRLETMKRELTNRRRAYSRIIERTSREIVAHKDDVQANFEEFAEGFLLEDCALAWAPHKDRIGESGPLIDFPAFELEMGGADFSSPVRRTGPEQVSESQREFIDLAFRMALIRVAGNGGVGSMVIDAPESSLDAVFVTRAADVLIRFASESDNRLVITSNLVEGNLIPELMRKGGIKTSSSKRVVDLLKVAAPTAATRELKKEYADFRAALFRRAKKRPRRR
jgi:energy-coupling factor transporter ATP-binding protein EcfA2